MMDPVGRRAGVLVGLAVVLTAGALGLVAWGPSPIGLDDWRWFRIAAPAWESALVALVIYMLIGFATVVACRRAGRQGRGGDAGVVALLAALAFVAQVLAAKQLPGDYHESIIAIGKAGANRYHTAAREVPDLRAVLGDYPHWMRQGSHKLIVTHPAGPLSLFWLLNHAFAGDEARAGRFVRWCEDRLAGGTHVRDPGGPYAAFELFARMTNAEVAGAWLATFALRLAASLLVLPVYAMARRLHGRHAGLVAAGFSAVVPSLLLYSPGLDQAFPVIAATACWLGWTAGEFRSRWRAAAAGATVAVGLFFSMSFAVVAAWAGLLALAALRRGAEPCSPRKLCELLAAAGVGLVAPVAVLYMAFAYNSLAVWSACLEANAKFNAQSGRVYWKWALANPVEFLVFLGIPVSCLFLGRLVTAVRGLRKGWRDTDWGVLVIGGLLVALNLLGLNRGEVSRLWMFLMPGCLVAAAAQIESYAPYRRAVLVSLFALQAIQATVFKSLLDVLLGMYRGLG